MAVLGFEQPPPGVVTEDRFGKRTTCYSCGANVGLWRAWELGPDRYLMMPHDKPRGEGPCRVKWAAPDLNTALARDGKLNPEEDRVYGRVFQWLHSCPGWDEFGECHHPICDRHRNDDPAPELVRLRRLRDAGRR